MSPAVGIHSPLLPASQEKSPSVSGAVLNVSTSILGAGIMSIPATLKVLGVIPAFLLIFIVACLVHVSVEFLVRYTNSGNSTTYGGVMKEAFGHPGSVSVQLCIMVTNFGCLIMYLIIIGDVLSGNVQNGSAHYGVLQGWLGDHWWNSRPFALFFIVVFIIFPLVLFRNIDSLRISSFISVLLALVFVGISSAMAIYALIEGKAENPRLLPRIDSHNSFFDLFTAVPVIVTAFTFHFNVHPIALELGKPSAMLLAVKISLLLCASIYFFIGLFGYLLFGESTMSDILINFDRNCDTAVGALLNDVVRLSYALHLMLVFPLLNFSLRGNMDEFLFPNRPVLVEDANRFASLTVSLLAVSYVAAIAIPDIWFVFQFVGSTAAVCIAFIFPGALVLRDAHNISTRRDKIMAAVMIALAVVTSVIAISTNVYTFVASKS